MDQLKIKRKPSKLKISLIILLSLILVVFSGVLYARFWYVNSLKPVSNDTTVVSEIIAPGSSLGDISSQLKNHGLIKSARAFEVYVRIQKQASKLKAGTYELSPSMSTQQVLDVLVAGKEAASLFTIGPGLRVDQIKQRFIKAGYSEEDITLAMDPANYLDIPVVNQIKDGESLEGFIYPESYQITESTTPKDIIRLSLVELNKVITPDMVAAFRSHNLSVYEAVTLASIVEKEVPSAEDRKVVAQIFEKRLDEGIDLGSDATYFYASAVFGGEPTPFLDSPYNTRLYSGLPPGPINNVGKTALEAVAYPADTDYLFFLTGDDGINYFTRTQAEHEQAIRDHCKITCASDYVPVVN
ncbi:endolytic transglycosylase MltG [Candidatus Saccharibacteria bacterium]|nr:endolytic transglycosylase MltG [Candidatus Saccharibacteria bacterium]